VPHGLAVARCRRVTNVSPCGGPNTVVAKALLLPETSSGLDKTV
jgi:hypothetical protein